MPMIVYVTLIYGRPKQTFVRQLFAKPTEEYLVKKKTKCSLLFAFVLMLSVTVAVKLKSLSGKTFFFSTSNPLQNGNSTRIKRQGFIFGKRTSFYLVVKK